MSDIINAFPGYEYVISKSVDKEGHEVISGKNMYRGEDVGKGGYVYAEPGVYGNVALLDVASLHPHSIIAMNCFGEYTKNFKDLLDARLYIKHRELDKARTMLNGKLAPFLSDDILSKMSDDEREKHFDSISKALKIAINSVYGLTAASFDNPFRDSRNVNNIVALRGALFMVNLKHEVQDRGFKVVHIKTDSIKIANATQDIIDFCMDYAKSYGYTFEHEATYDRICLVNNAVYIARYSSDRAINGKHAGQWTATGKQFQVPYVFKKLFSHEDIEFRDLCETREVQTGIYLDMNENLPDVSQAEKRLEKLRADISKKGSTSEEIENEIGSLNDVIRAGHNLRYIGKVGLFTPVIDGAGGGLLVRLNDHGDIAKYDSVAGAKEYRWLESEIVQMMGYESKIDYRYFDKLVEDARAAINERDDFEWFVSSPEPFNPLPF